ncbi:hypothetical protein GCM10011309_10020 [Litorimonas cladophorae]|uniref:Uncharacterized protein n=1 Tax=Litorimonas cladophorae TaxID=1220491 RepID=A0A918NCD2_9PROT|nr:hypothetical protein GCM10011309_10020 [Litorimonas cladophorae]
MVMLETAFATNAKAMRLERDILEGSGAPVASSKLAIPNPRIIKTKEMASVVKVN